jgi:hypothetical protein
VVCTRHKLIHSLKIKTIGDLHLWMRSGGEKRGGVSRALAAVGLSAKDVACLQATLQGKDWRPSRSLSQYPSSLLSSQWVQGQLKRSSLGESQIHPTNNLSTDASASSGFVLPALESLHQPAILKLPYAVRKELAYAYISQQSSEGVQVASDENMEAMDDAVRNKRDQNGVPASIVTSRASNRSHNKSVKSSGTARARKPSSEWVNPAEMLSTLDAETLKELPIDIRR